MTSGTTTSPGRGPLVGWQQRIAEADVVVLGPAPPLRGGIAAHSARLVEQLRGQGTAACAVSYVRLYPQMLFPGRNQRTAACRPPWCEEVIDALAPPNWWEIRRVLSASRATVVLQWWHPLVAPALLAITSGLARERVVAVCHNALPHEPVPGAAAAARAVLARCGRIVCHSAAQADLVRRLLGSRAGPIEEVPLPCLLPAADFEGSNERVVPAELLGLPPDARCFVAAGHQRPYKGIAVLLKAWAMARRPPGTRLLLVGESYLRGPARREVARRAGKDSSIILVDRYVEDGELVCFLDSAEALVAAHLAASQSGMIPIALALGLPCIVSDAGGLAVQAGAGAGPGARVVVRAGDVAALATSLEERLELAPRRAANQGTPGVRRRRPDFTKDWQRVVEAMGIGRRP